MHVRATGCDQRRLGDLQQDPRREGGAGHPGNSGLRKKLGAKPTKTVARIASAIPV